MPERLSIAAMRATGKIRQTTGTHVICLDAGLADAYVAKREELAAALAEYEDAKAEDHGGRAGGQGSKVTKAKKKTERLGRELDVIADNMAEYEVETMFHRHPGGEWNRFTADHPPRTDTPDEYGRRPFVLRDGMHGGVVDFDALVEALPDWLDTLNGEPLTDDDWAFVVENASPGDLDALGQKIIDLHTQAGVSAPKSVSGSLSTLLADIDSKPLADGRGRPRNGSTAGSPPGSPSTSTTTDPEAADG